MADVAREIEYLLRQGADYTVAPDVGSDVLDQIEAFLTRFVIHPDEGSRHAHVLWIAHTWLMDCWEQTPRLLLVSPEPGSGKTRALTVTEQLVPRADFVGDLTPAALYHAIDDAWEMEGGRPTILYDELDTVFGNEEDGHRSNHRMRRMIDLGHERTGALRRVVKGRSVRYEMYAPMALAGKMEVHDVPATVRSRSVVVRMQRPLPEDKIEKWNRQTSSAEAEPIRGVLAMWAELVHSYAANDYRLKMPEGIENRDADVWAPLLSMADLAGGRWPQLARLTALTTLTAWGVNATPSVGVRLLWTVADTFERLGVDQITSRQLLAELSKTGEFSWADLPPQRAGIRLATILNGYGVRPAALWVDGRTVKGYRRESFADAWRRYPSGKGGKSGKDSGDE